ncbi:MAG: hypothetical protein G01um101418_132 [Parcubacteria group bacterium Gr01-1014_18]|nr:MAG: hypothetical protein Greene041636_436 [Parcubacteria group bacterium Greene0416_36]TSC81459.1 MAG: hypothetical protein G01um101418_132 [Parcubacteria group bacterium Gr01-1014_18]TSC99057.1 MAG: hypothetical protein Greene101420_413 [Parcubacteria group bacterium Greene1014_20]TSD07262.1 MAG: hypothetical protein Greene07142_278 [Parcubacteria group bacterium Greene0714_2]
MKNWKTTEKKAFLKKIQTFAEKALSQATKEMSFEEAMKALESGEKKKEQTFLDLFSASAVNKISPPTKPEDSEFLQVVGKDFLVPACDGKATIIGSSGVFHYIDPNF